MTMNKTTALKVITMTNSLSFNMSVDCIVAVKLAFILSTYQRVPKRDQINDRLCLRCGWYLVVGAMVQPQNKVSC